tara:strand:+ start:441 stop:1121 length:681 start_codon:yes stop_codon:yes gene_type:complete
MVNKKNSNLKKSYKINSKQRAHKKNKIQKPKSLRESSKKYKQNAAKIKLQKFRGKPVKVISYKVKSSKPVKSSFKKSSRNLKVKWSPDVRQIERPNIIKEDVSLPKKTYLYLKIHNDKTFVMKGILHASYLYKKKPLIVLTLYDEKNRMMAKTNINFKCKNISHVQTQDFNIHNDGKTRIRVLFKLGDIIWCHGNKKVQRSQNCQGFDLSWLHKMYEFYAQVMRKY